MTWRRYHRYADILRYLEYLQHSYSDFVELIPLGRSSEGLPLVVIKVFIDIITGLLVQVANLSDKEWLTSFMSVCNSQDVLIDALLKSISRQKIGIMRKKKRRREIKNI